MLTSHKLSRIRRIKRVRAKISGTEARPRLAVYRSNRQISAQLIDDTKGVTLASASSTTIKDKLKPIEKATKVGEEIAEKASIAKIQEAVFDRRDKKYHGQVKALAEAARAKGLRI
jgi:large subunit ribosomal protein L18